MSVYNLKDIIRLNQEVGEEGQLQNESSLAFALSLSRGKKSWLYELTYLVRSLVVDHAFVDGNKRTAYLLCSLMLQDAGKAYEDRALVETIHKIARKSTKDINQIARWLRAC